jgi:hypothetical protein
MHDSRSRFEAWARSLPYRFYFDCFTDTNGVTCYASSNTQSAWEAWQAAEAETARRCADLIKTAIAGFPMESHYSAGTALDGICRDFPEAWK